MKPNSDYFRKLHVYLAKAVKAIAIKEDKRRSKAYKAMLGGKKKK